MVQLLRVILQDLEALGCAVTVSYSNGEVVMGLLARHHQRLNKLEAAVISWSGNVGRSSISD